MKPASVLKNRRQCFLKVPFHQTASLLQHSACHNTVLIPKRHSAMWSEHTIHIFSNFLRPFSTQMMPFTTGDDGQVRDTRLVTNLPPKDTQASQLQKLLSNPTLTSALIIVMWKQLGNVLLTLVVDSLVDPVHKPCHSLVLAHTLYGWDVIFFGPSSYPKLQIHYWCAGNACHDMTTHAVILSSGLIFWRHYVERLVLTSS